MIPPFNAHEVLPPFLGTPTQRSGRSPFLATIDEVVDRFATSDRRRSILTGLLNFRTSLRAAGMVVGNQWLDGSFVENRPTEPNDVDVVTFHELAPADEAAFASANLALVRSSATKAAYMVDAYFVSLRSLGAVADATYWYGLFSHQRVTERWKGILQVPLASSDDDGPARALLAKRTP
jgi:hypothetical protein